MGEELADKSVQGEITNKEWKTPALWGIGLTKSVNPRATFYMTVEQILFFKQYFYMVEKQPTQ